MSNFVNPAFKQIFKGISRAMPGITFFGIIGTYVITAALTVHFIPLPALLAIPAALSIQFGRFAVVFQDFLNPTGIRSPWPPIIATLATCVALSELAFSIRDMEWAENRFWSVFLFGSMVVLFGYILELQFIHKGAEAFGMVRRSADDEDGATPGASTPPQSRRDYSPLEEEEAIPFDFENPSTNGNGTGRHH